MDYIHSNFERKISDFPSLNPREERERGVCIKFIHNLKGNFHEIRQNNFIGERTVQL